MTEPAWPELPADWVADPATVAKYRELLLAAKIALAKDALETTRSRPASLADDPSELKLHETLAALVVGSIDRARDGAKFVETAAAALATVYTGILAFSFAAASTHLPARGVYSAIFLGLAIVGASFYLAFITQIAPIGRVDYRGARPEDQWRRTEYLGTWTGAVVRTRSWALRGAVVALAWGVVFMPLAFLPDRIAANSSALQPSAAATQPAPTWPAPPSAIKQRLLAAVLYKAQLDEFAKSKGQPQSVASADGIPADLASFGLFLVALVTLAGVAGWDVIKHVWQRLLAQRSPPPSTA